MRALWRALGRIVFWSYERGTLPYDIAVGLIVVFVLLSPRSWFEDRPQTTVTIARAVTPSGIEMRGIDPQDGATIYRVNAKLVGTDSSQLEHELHEMLRKQAQHTITGNFEILRIAAVREPSGTITYYDVFVRQ